MKQFRPSLFALRTSVRPDFLANALVLFAVAGLVLALFGH